jgi:uncharacterized protein YihD (DUF1040 family)
MRFGTIFGIFVVVTIIVLIYMQVKEHYSQNDPVLLTLKESLNNFVKNTEFDGDLTSLNDDNFMKKIKFYKGEKSYTINKSKIYLCLKDEDDEYYDMNMLTYVALHEIAHCICDEIGHTEKFDSILSQLLKDAAIYGIFDPSKPLIDQYCEYND